MSIARIKIVVFLLAFAPAAWLTYAVLTDQLGANPIEEVTRDSGTWALRFLLITLTMTPLRWLTDWPGWIQFRRMMGLYCFFYACLHMLLYLWLDKFFDWPEILADIIERPFITIGFISFTLLVPLAATSTKAMIKRLGRRWKKLHKLTYVIACLACLHFLMLVKADIREPLLYIFILATLLFMRFYRATIKPIILARQ
ncbi:membrane-like protein [Methylophaga frappieri]|uniref:Protein-methionine-sulfoxide reductase heme-binding subunit MsrQ n=1 Tax=Methylophaga frappieri (strain ATCC BAA-2434 / DSM 25690 / JAM7) TaxID=754477 RepID=I1YEF8_METFJ|nr:protein-methionine-sulfoxide reductase heme-binding subunit MsrQ [Methylophaga frappieri]AFJ01301.1 membrane-like protein [Methylophaga frappieri]